VIFSHPMQAFASGKGYEVGGGRGGGSQQPLKSAREPLPSQHARVGPPSPPWSSAIEAGKKNATFFLGGAKPRSKKNHEKFGTLILHIYNTKYYFAFKINKRAIFACRISIWVVWFFFVRGRLLLNDSCFPIIFFYFLFVLAKKYLA